MDISRPCQPEKLIRLLPWPGFDPSFSGHNDRRAITSEWTRLRLKPLSHRGWHKIQRYQGHRYVSKCKPHHSGDICTRRENNLKTSFSYMSQNVKKIIFCAIWGALRGGGGSFNYQNYATFAQNWTVISLCDLFWWDLSSLPKAKALIRISDNVIGLHS